MHNALVRLSTVTLDMTDAMELSELLDYLAQWLELADDHVRADLAAFSPTPPGPCRTHCAVSTAGTLRWPSSRCWSALDDDLAAEATRLSNRLRGLLTQVHPALERVLGPRIHHPAVLELLARFGGPGRLRKAGRRRLLPLARRLAPRMGEQLVTDVLAALDAQTVVVPGIEAAERVLPRLAASLRDTLAHRQRVATEVEEILDAHPLAKVLTSMPGIGVRTAACLLLEISDISAFPSAGHLAAYAGLAPVTRRSGSSIRGEHPPRGGNKALKRTLFQSALRRAIRPDQPRVPRPQASPGKRHNAALICLARHRVDVLFAMLRDGTLYQAPMPQAA